ncbi:MAG TPA: type I pullulanase [Parafilimonas sp.]|nr:type I pullulanase [Parafilimonas sp.]
MKKFIPGFVFFFIVLLANAQDYDTYPVYHGQLGLMYSKSASSFRIWSPVAEEAKIVFYKDGAGGTVVQTESMKKDDGGTWYIRINKDLKGAFYTFSVKVNDTWLNEVPDPYAKAVGVNGKRAMVVDLKETDPPNWNSDKSPPFSKNNYATDAVIYELHVRDASIDDNSGIQHKGKFLGLTETGTKNNARLSTGLDHLKELGITHVHLLPCFDFSSIDESKPDSAQYNWGYDPLNYNVPEGSYSTNPYDGVTRIKEFKKLVQTFHSNGLRVVIDVVYNHTGVTANSNFNQLVPGYYYRHKSDGSFSDATACGNETASERPMFRKFMLESVMYWVREYHVDGFRFDLMGVHDIETMNLISDSLHKIKPDIILYGEGWTAGDCPLPDSLRALKPNAYKLHGIAVFSDDIRDGIKGSVFDINDRGFASGKAGMEESVKFGIVASCSHPQVDYQKVNYSKAAYAAAPWNTITYCECHDNNTLWDKLSLSYPTATEEARVHMQQLALTIVLTSQGIPFLHAGTEFLRNKKGVENSFNKPDSINEIDWDAKTKYRSTTNYLQYLIRLRKEHPAFRMTTDEGIKKNIVFDATARAGTIIYTINGSAAGDKWKRIWIAFNGTDKELSIPLPQGSWKTAVDSNGMHEMNRPVTGQLNLKGYSSAILYED